MLEKIKYYFRDELWNFPLSQKRGVRHVGLKWLRIAYLAARGFYQDKCSLSASSLTYYTIMSIVPVLAMAIAIARGFGYHEVFRAEILNRFQDQNTALVELFKYANAFLEEARGGVIAGFGLLILFLTVALLLSNLEAILNHIWHVKKLRPWKRILSDYFALMLIAPIFFVIASSASVFILDHLEVIIRDLPIASWISSWLLFFVNLIPYGLFWVLFTFIYIFMPNFKVHFCSACFGGLVASALYLVVQWGYIYFQIGVTRYGAIYGSMAALPLFLIWVQVSWFILLFGAEISYAHQTLDEHEFEGKAHRVSHSFKRVLALWVVHFAVKKGFFTREMLVQQYQIPTALIKPILTELVACHILYESRGGYVAAYTAHELRISDVIEALESKGESDFPFIESQELIPFGEALKQFREQIESSPYNQQISHVSNTI